MSKKWYSRSQKRLVSSTKKGREGKASSRCPVLLRSMRELLVETLQDDSVGIRSVLDGRLQPVSRVVERRFVRRDVFFFFWRRKRRRRKKDDRRREEFGFQGRRAQRMGFV